MDEPLQNARGMSAYSLRRRLASNLPPPSEPDIYNAVTLPMPLHARLVATMTAADSAAAERELLARRRRREHLVTLDRANPFLYPSPHAPWQPGPPLVELRPGYHADGDRSGELLGIAVLVWSTVVALVLLALAIQ